MLGLKEPQLRNTLIPTMPFSQEELVATAEHSELGWRMGRRLSSDDRLNFFDHLRRNQYVYQLEVTDGTNEDKPLINSFLESLQYPYDGGGNFGLESILGDESMPFAYTGGYIFTDDDNNLQLFLAKKTNKKKIPFGDFHDIAAGQFAEKFRTRVEKKPNSQRCLFFQVWNTANSSIEYYVVPVDTIHQEDSQLRLGEAYNDQATESLTDKQIADFEKQYSVASYAQLKIILNSADRRHKISAMLASEQLLPAISERLNNRIYWDMDPEQAQREAMRESILTKAGVNTAFSKYWSSEND